MCLCGLGVLFGVEVDIFGVLVFAGCSGVMRLLKECVCFQMCYCRLIIRAGRCSANATRKIVVLLSEFVLIEFGVCGTFE